MTVEQALEILNKYDGMEMTDEQYYNYHCAQNKITRLILRGEYELVKKVTERPQDDIFPMEIAAGKCPIEVGGNCPLQPQGEWTIGYTAKQKKVAVCNLCNCISFQGKTNFCHNCGAKMQKGGAE